MIVPTPTVSAVFGTAMVDPLKKRAFASTVSYARVLTCQTCLDQDSEITSQTTNKTPTRVLLERELPGSLNAMCPSIPIPPRELFCDDSPHKSKQKNVKAKRETNEKLNATEAFDLFFVFFTSAIETP